MSTDPAPVRAAATRGSRISMAGSYPPFRQVATASEAVALRRLVADLQTQLVSKDNELEQLRKLVPWCSVCKAASAQVGSNPCHHLSVCRDCYNQLSAGGRPFRCPVCREPTDHEKCFVLYLP